MNREMRRIQEREERLQKKQDPAKDKASRRAAALQSKPLTTERKSFFRRIEGYLHEVRQEMRKVTWPTREQMIAFTTVTVVTCVILTGVVFGLDVAMKKLVFQLLEWSL
ncbi:MAG TPA: preprotein translocase subunit SecE [Acidimicrobiia bacterium]|nr:preprotein translocase subunit SecE [Acidimicrobiia bacterium]